MLSAHFLFTWPNIKFNPFQMELTCAVKLPVFVTVKDIDGTLRQPPRVSVLDLSLKCSSNVAYISFRNHYTHSVTVRYRREGERHWQLCTKSLVLMPSCHCEQGAESYVVLGREQFLCALERVQHLRLILRQPSPHWREFSVLDLRCFGEEWRRVDQC